MAITAAEAKAWETIYAEGFANTNAPYYGVNTFDVRKENWDAMLKNAHGQNKGVEAYGGRLHLWAATDLGEIMRVVWINYFPKNIAEAAASVPMEINQEQMELTHEAMTLYDKYHWFCAKELPEGPTTIA